MSIHKFWNNFIQNEIDKVVGCKDIDDNYYSLEKFNNKTWTISNLNVSRFRNGDQIKEVKSDEEWIRSYENKEPTWCYYDNDPKNKMYGKLYNLYAIIDYRGLAPEKYRIPSDNEWNQLAEYMGGNEIAGEKLGFLSKFKACYGGARSEKGFEYINIHGVYWTSSLNSIDKAWIRVFYLLIKNLGRNNNSKYLGAYVRCIKE
jgi:uncharacterized protein (TIGR02145 family)